MWRLRQVVKTPPSHGGFKGSNPLGVTIGNQSWDICPGFFVFLDHIRLRIPLSGRST